MTTTALDRDAAADLVAERLDALFETDQPDQTAFWGRQFDLGLAWVGFPVGLGGLGLEPELQQLVNQRLAAEHSPDNLALNFMGVLHMPPTVLAFGSDELQRRFLRRSFTCEDLWCQLFSEPGAGSDLASLATRADRDGDEWVVNGQKVWTTLAHVADWGLLLARTDVDVPKHAGMTYFIVDMHAPGVEVRPLRQMTGEAEYNEVYFSDVRIPDKFRLGGVGDGWRVATTTLMNERIAVEGIGNSERGSGPVQRLLEVWGQADSSRRSPARRDDVVRLWIQAEVVRMTRIRAVQLRQRGSPGPEASIGKLAVGLLHQRIFDLCMNLSGPEATLIDHYDMVQPTVLIQASNEDAPLTKTFLAFQGITIGGGTTEINKTLVAERVLRLPSEPRPDKTLPWNQVPRS